MIFALRAVVTYSSLVESSVVLDVCMWSAVNSKSIKQLPCDIILPPYVT
jgi:hypothetical protein